MTTNIKILKKAAISWWENNRPVGWTLQHHLAHHQINTRNRCEQDLADAVAAYWCQKSVCGLGVCARKKGHKGRHSSGD
jgi:uncharacterized protein YgfB (UPF0149 family)